MLIKPDWDKFTSNFSENPQKNFEWMCYQLFCREFNRDEGVFRYYNQPALESEPIQNDGDVIGFQAKFYTVKLSERKTEIMELIQDIKSKYPNLTILHFYSNQEWTASPASNDMRTNAQKDIENFASENGFRIEWKTKSFFESEFVTIENSDIAQYFFASDTNEYYKKIRKIREAKTRLSIDNIFPTSLYIENTQRVRSDKNALSDFIISQFRDNELQDFSNIFIRGVAGIGKSTEMRIAYQKLIDKCSHENCYREFRFLPTPYFYELKNYQQNCFKITEKETPVLFLDGVDEIPHSELQSFVRDLSNMTSLNPSVRFIISGRDASFPVEINSLKHIDVRLSYFIDTDLQNLMYRFKGTIFEPFVGIPFYRTFLCSQGFKNINTYKEFIKTLITSRLEDDKQKFDRSENAVPSIDDGIDLNAIQNKLAGVAYRLFKSRKRVFSKIDLKKYFNKKEILFLSNSCLFDYKNEETISFFSNIYFEYFVATYYSRKNYSLARKELFLSTGKVIVQNVNIVTMLLNLISNTTRLYKKLTKQLNCETVAYILLTDYTLLSSQERFNFYKKIIEEFNATGKIIYYISFRHSHDLLKNIDSLSDSMHKLLPEEFYDDTVKMHCDSILHFIENSSCNEITEFENAVILLGIHGKIWNISQQTLLKETSIPLIKFFRESELAKKMKGLLSEDIIFSWYEDYGWTNDWGENKWKTFVKDITGIETGDFCHFNSETEFRLKLKLFIHFHKNGYIRKLLVPLVMKTLENKNDDVDTAAFVPSSLDDEFETPTIHFDNDISYFTYAIKNYEIQVSDLLLILTSCIGNYIHHSLSYQLEELYKEIINLFKNSIHNISDDEMPKLCELFKKYIDTDSGTYISDFGVYINLLDDNQKEKLFTLLLDDLKQKEEWQRLWMLHRPIVLLLDISDENESRLLFDKLKEIDRVYRECVADIYITRLTNHPLYHIAFVEYPRLFPGEVEKEKCRTECLSRFETEKEAMLDKEIDIISSKEELLNEIHRVFKYLDKGENVPQNDTDRGKLIELQADYIGNKIQYACSKRYSVPPVFSSFTIKYLFNCTDNNKKLNREQAIKNIEDWFSDEKYFWRYFFWLFMCHYKKEETDEFLEKYTELVERIKTSMEKEVSYFLANDGIETYDGGRNRYWVVPFVHYIGRFYNNILPDWIDKKKILNFIAYPAWQLSRGFGAHVNGEFKWQKWNSVFDWIEEVSRIDEGSIIKYALDLLPQLKSDQSQSQIITIFVEKVKSESAYKQQMLDAIIEKTIVEIKKDYEELETTSIMNGGALSSFWRETEENIIDKIYSYIDFSKYSVDDVNYCRKSVLEYFCKVATEKQKTNAIKTLKKKIDDENIRIYLAKLGYDKAIIKTINKFLAGENLDTNLSFYTPLFGKTKKTFHLVLKYCQLYKYSFEKSSDRRQYLTEYARAGIMQTVSRRNFWLVKRLLNNLIEERKRKGLYYEGIYDFLNEIEQTVFGSDII